MANIKIGLTRESGIIDVYNKQWINSVESTSQSTTDPATIEYGVLANSGSINLRDLNGKIRNDLESGDLPISNVETTISINDTQIQAHLTNDSNYTESDKTLSLSLTNKLSLFDSMSYNGFPLSETPMTAYELLSDIFSKLGVDMANDVTFTTDALNALTAITIPYPYIKPCSGREALNKICEIAQLSMFQSDNGKIRVISTTQKNSASTVYPYRVPSHYKIAELNKAIVLKNKYDAIDMKGTKVSPIKDIAIPVYSWNSLNNQISITETKDVNGTYQKTDMYIRVTYWSFDVVIPKKSPDNKETIDRILTGVDANGNSNIRWLITGTQRQGTVDAVYPDIGAEVEYRTNYGNEQQWAGKIETFKVEKPVGGSELELVDKTNVNTVTVVDNGDTYSLFLTIAVGQEYYYYQLSGSIISLAMLYKPEKLEVTVLGDKRTIRFEDVDVSTSNISTSKNPVSLRHNELMQLGATWGDTSLVDKIKDNVLTDYENGIPTATIDLFSGSLSNGKLSQTLDWSSGEILSVGDKIKFADDKEELVWDITGRTFTYNASPKLSLELKKFAVWRTLWQGSMECPFPSMSGSNATDDGYYYGRQTTTINLDDYGITSSDIIRISGLGNYGSTIVENNYYVDGLELRSGFTTIVQSNPNLYGVASAYYSKTTNTLEITMSGRNTRPDTLLLSTLTFTLTKIEQFY